MRLGDLAAGLEGLVGPGPQGGEADVEISSLAYDSRAVADGTLFFCVPGFRSDGHRFAPAAVDAGAAALVVERPLGLGVPELEVRSVRAAMAPLAARFYGVPPSAAGRRRHRHQRQDDERLPRPGAAARRVACSAGCSAR